jgi:hypothetical protein
MITDDCFYGSQVKHTGITNEKPILIRVLPVKACHYGSYFRHKKPVLYAGKFREV